MSNSEMAALIIKILFAVLSIFLTSYVVPFLEELTESYRNTKIENFVRKSVEAAEQVIKGSKKGKEKKAKVLESVSKWLKSKNIDLSEEEIDEIIESIVYAMNHPEESV